MKITLLPICALVLPVVFILLAEADSAPDETGFAMSEPGLGEHKTLAHDLDNYAVPFNQPALVGENSATRAVGLVIPRGSIFNAGWAPVSGAIGYRLDVSTTSSFATYVSGYEHLNVGSATSHNVSGLNPGSLYYYRVRAYDNTGALHVSEVAAVGLASASAGLTIDATFDSSITTSPNAAAIESMINQAVAIYESLYHDPIRVSILFRYSKTQPNGTALDPGLVAGSLFVYYTLPWNTYINGLKADAKGNNDNSAIASLPAFALSTNLNSASANGRAVGFNTPPAMFANGSVGAGGPYDGIVTLNAGRPFQFSRPTAGGYYDALRTTEHEMDEVLGLGSHLNGTGNDLRPQDLFSWSAPGMRNYTTSGTRYFSINGGKTALVTFNQQSRYDFGDWFSSACPQQSPLVQNAFGCPGQSSDVSANSPEGINLDVIGYDLGTAVPAQLLNVSTRLDVLRNDSVLIGGFIVSGSRAKKVMIRALGPSLAVPGALADPTLELHFPNGAVVSNDNWKVNQQTGQSQETVIRATTIPPPQDSESALVQTVAPGAYTAIVKGKSGGTGIGLVEAYDLEQGTPARLANISTRGFVSTDSNVMIGGFILGPTKAGSAKVVIRAIGPSLPINGALQNPTLELRDPNGVKIAANDDWQQDSGAGEISGHNLAPKNPAESALLRVLSPGGYTAIVSGANGGLGIGLVEVYHLL